MKESPKQPSRALPIALGAVAFLSVFVLVIITATLITFILPPTYSSTCRIHVGTFSGTGSNTNSSFAEVQPQDPYLMQTELEIIQSEVVLSRVVEDMDLNVEWGNRYLEGSPLTTLESLKILRRQLDLRPVRGTGLIEITIFSPQPEEAAKLANAIATSYIAYISSQSDTQRVHVIDTAHPAIRAVKPNKPLNIIVGGIVGVLVGLICGLLTFFIVLILQRRRALRG